MPPRAEVRAGFFYGPVGDSLSYHLFSEPDPHRAKDRLLLALQRPNVTEPGAHNVVVTFDTGPNLGASVGLTYTVMCYVQNRDPTAGPVTDSCGSVAASSLEPSGTVSGSLPGVYTQVVADVTGLGSGTQYDCLVEVSLAAPRVTKCQFAGNISTSWDPEDWRLGGDDEGCDTVCDADGLACNFNGMRNVLSFEEATYVAYSLGIPTDTDLTPWVPFLDLPFTDEPGYYPSNGQVKVGFDACISLPSSLPLTHSGAPLWQWNGVESLCEGHYPGFVRFWCVVGGWLIDRACFDPAS